MKTFAVVASLILHEFIDFIWGKIQLIKGKSTGPVVTEVVSSNPGTRYCSHCFVV